MWAVGVTANTFEGIAKSSLGKGGRMITDQYNQLKGYDNVYAIGDISIQYDDRNYPNGHPQLAQPAIQQGKRLAKNLLLQARKRNINHSNILTGATWQSLAGDWLLPIFSNTACI